MTLGNLLEESGLQSLDSIIDVADITSFLLGLDFAGLDFFKSLEKSIFLLLLLDIPLVFVGYRKITEHCLLSLRLSAVLTQLVVIEFGELALDTSLQALTEAEFLTNILGEPLVEVQVLEVGSIENVENLCEFGDFEQIVGQKDSLVEVLLNVGLSLFVDGAEGGNVIRSGSNVKLITDVDGQLADEFRVSFGDLEESSGDDISSFIAFLIVASFLEQTSSSDVHEILLGIFDSHSHFHLLVGFLLVFQF